MTAHVVSLLLLVCLIGTFFLGRPFLVRHIRTLFWLGVAAIFVTLACQSTATYFSWMNDPGAGQFLLPPTTPINYFLFYIFTRIFLPYLVALAFAGIAFLTAKYTNKLCHERFFYPEEYYFLALGIFLAGHPFWLGYLILSCVVYVIYTLISAMNTTEKEQPRVSMYYFWLPLALVITLSAPFLKTTALLALFRLS